MAIVTISRGSYSRGKEIAEQVAQKLGYACISREALLETSKEFNTTAVKLIQSMEDIPSVLDRFKYSKETYIAYIQATLLKHLRKDNVVYHGFAAQFFVKDISHVLKVRITADLEDRIGIVMERDKVSRKEASRFLIKIDEQRRKWNKHLYGVDPSDASHYDLVIHIHTIPVEAAVDTVCHLAGLKELQTTSESRQAMEDLALAAEVKAALLDVEQNIHVSAHDGLVSVKTEAAVAEEADFVRNVQTIAKAIPGVKDVNVQVSFYGA